MDKAVSTLAALMLGTIVLGRVAANAELDNAHLVCKEVSLGKIAPAMIKDSLKGSPDSRRVAYKVNQNNKEVMVVDGVAGKAYDEIQAFQFSPDGRRWACIARLAETERVVTDGKEGRVHDGIEWFNLQFSPDSKHVGYVARTGRFDDESGREVAVVDDKEGKEYGRIADLEFSPDSKHVGFRFQLPQSQDAAMSETPHAHPAKNSRLAHRFQNR